MTNIVARCLPLFLLLPLLLLHSGCGCGFDCNNGNNNNNNSGNAVLTLGFSDALPEELKEVVITVDSITFSRSGTEPVVVDTFTIDGRDEGEDTFSLNLLDYPGNAQLDVITNLELSPGTYSVAIDVIDDDINNSFVTPEATDIQAELKVPGGSLDLSGLSLASGPQTVAVEFALAQALVFGSDAYQLTTTGMRMEVHSESATLIGGIDSTLFNTVSPCDEKSPSTDGNRVYLYEGADVATENMADVFIAEQVADSPPDNAVAPFAVASITQNASTSEWTYSFGYLPPGDYTIAFACNTADDNSVEYDEITIPLPAEQVYTVELLEGEQTRCNLTADANC